MRLLLFLLVLLQATLVRPLTYTWHGDFNAGSLITVYFKHIKQSGEGNRVVIDLWADYEEGLGRLHFRLDDNRAIAPIVSNVMEKSGGKWGTEGAPPGFWFPEPCYPPPTKDGDWWRFDLYKISDTTYLPFFQGFRAGIRTMKNMGKSTTLSIVPHMFDKGSFDQDDVTVDFRPTNKYSTGKPQLVEAAMDRSVSTEKNKDKPLLTTLDRFPDGAELKLSVMQVSWDASFDQNKLPKSSLLFYSNDDKWSFGLETIWDKDQNKPILRLVHGMTKAEKYFRTNCTGTNADLVHARLERVGRTIKARIDYKDGWPEQYECEIEVAEDAVKYLDTKLKVLGYQGAALLYLATEDLYYY